jgi:hypothetical protein
MMPACLAWRRVAPLMAVIVSGWGLAGCATYSDSFGAVQHKLAAQQYEAALQDIEKQTGSTTDRVLYLLNRGMVQRMKRDFAGSNESLEAAKSEMEKLYAASVSENSLSFVVNDATVSYAGDNYEQVLVHLYMALNYLELGQLYEARVEALQVDIKLREIGEDAPGDKFTEDAFSRYLSGLIYEEMGEWSDAMIAYRKAYDAYRKYEADHGLATPDMLKHDLLRVSARLGLSDETQKYRQEFGIEPLQETGNESGQEGELIFVLNNGLAPIKRERVVGGSTLPPSVAVDTARPYRQTAAVSPVLVQIALPFYESRPNKVLYARVSVSGRQTVTQMMDDIDAIARTSLDARMPAITARTMARAVAKVALQESVDRAGRSRSSDAGVELLGSFLVRVAAVATERADTRSWLTLPSNIQLARLSLPPGSYGVTVELLGAGDQVLATRDYPEITINRKRKTYLTQHWVSD